MDREDYRSTLPRFREATEAFYSGGMTAKEYKSISGGYGSYAQRGGKTGMVRLRLSGGRITPEKLGFICGCIEEYRPSKVHLTTCQSVQLHGLSPEAIPEIVGSAIDADIITFGGGGDYPRNVTATTLSGIIPSSEFDVLPYAEAAGKYLLDIAFGKKLPRKLKVGFTSTMENIADATARDLGFVAESNGKFGVYSGGGLGANPKLGLLVRDGLDPKDVFACLSAMVSMFMSHGNYQDRSRARVRYMRDDLGDAEYVRKFNEELDKALADPSIPKADPDPIVIDKTEDGSVPTTAYAKRQKQDGLFYVRYHPIGGDPRPEKILELRDAVEGIESAEIRIGPNQTLYVANLTGSEADMIASVLSDGAATMFEASTSCVGNSICQTGLRDSNGLLRKLFDMEKENGFADGTLPMVRISGCQSSCSAHQLGTIGLKGAPSIDGEPTFEISANGSHVLGKERLGTVLGRVREKDIPGLFRDIGKAVESSGKGTFRGWCDGDASRIAEIAGDRLIERMP